MRSFEVQLNLYIAITALCNPVKRLIKLAALRMTLLCDGDNLMKENEKVDERQLSGIQNLFKG